MGPEALASGPTPYLSACLSARACCARTRAIIDRQSVRCSGLVNALLDDVLAGNELAGGTRPQLLHGQAAHHLLVGGRALGARARQEAEEPVDERAHLRLEADDVEQVQETPGHPRGEARHLRVTHHHDRLEARDRRHRPLIEVGELRRPRLTARQARGDGIGGEARRLDRALRDAGDARERHHVTQHEDLGVPWQGEVLVDGDAACAVHLGARGLAQRAAQRARRHANVRSFPLRAAATLPSSVLLGATTVCGKGFARELTQLLGASLGLVAHSDDVAGTTPSRWCAAFGRSEPCTCPHFTTA